MTSCLDHHDDPAPVCPEKPERPGDYPVRRENFEAPVPILGAVRLLEVQKCLVEEKLPHVRELLWQIGPEGRGPRPTSLPKPVQHVMKRDRRSELLIQESGNHIPRHLDEANPPEVSAIHLGNQYKFLPSALVVQRSNAELCLHYINHLLKIGGSRLFFPRSLV